MLAGGVEIDVWLTDMQTNQDVVIRTAPSGYSSVEDIQQDVQQTNTFKLLEEWVERNELEENDDVDPVVIQA